LERDWSAGQQRSAVFPVSIHLPPSQQNSRIWVLAVCGQWLADTGDGRDVEVASLEKTKQSKTAHLFLNTPMPLRPPLSGFCKAVGESFGFCPRPRGIWRRRGVKNVLILPTFTFYPGLDEQDELSTGNANAQVEGDEQAIGSNLAPIPRSPNWIENSILPV
jgi:hypothetical protein